MVHGRGGDVKEEPVIRPATMADILAVDALRKSESAALGFVPIQTYEDVTKGLHPSERVWIVEYNKQMAGFAYIGGGGHFTKIFQLAIWDDARRLDIGNAVVSKADKLARERGQFGLTCRVAHDLPSNEFWKAIGFSHVGTNVGKFLNHDSISKRPVYNYERLQQSRLWTPDSEIGHNIHAGLVL
jgi:ribosomal protein S18 acetylase RimI-like enzyme